MQIPFTQEQLQVIRHREGNLLVSAAAGSGKTAVLVERIIQMMLDPVNPVPLDQILVVTFTNAATAQMKEKLEKRIQELLEEDEDNLYLQEQAHLVQLASIQTNHAFSLRIVRDYITHLPGIDPGYRVADETEIKLLRSDVLRDVLEDFYSRGMTQGISRGASLNPGTEEADQEVLDFLAFSESYGGTRQDVKLEELLLGIYEYMMSDPEPFTWLRRCVSAYDPEEALPLVWQQLTEESLRETLGKADWSLDSEDLVKEKALVHRPLRGMEAVLKAFDKAYRKAKEERNLLEFHDFEHGALTILQDEAVAQAERERYRYIYIDEYQDCNRMQETIIHRIARKNAAGQDCNVFMVGDVKQSIYRFRQADPSLFVEKYHTYGSIPGTSVLTLNRNFRSSGSILQAVNDVFASLMREEIGGLGYGPKEALYAGRQDLEEAKVSLTVLEHKESSVRNREEALEAARMVQQLHEIGYEFRDIVILQRSVRSSGKLLVEALAEAGIPAYAPTNENFYDTIEVKTVLNLLRVIDNPHQDIPLLGVLVSPIVGLSGDDLGRVRLALSEGDFYDALRVYAEEGTAADAGHEKAKAFLENLSRWQLEARLYVIHDFLWRLLLETGYYTYACAMPVGEIRRANLELLLQKCIDFEKGIYSGLYAFLRYIDQMDRERKQEDEAKLFSESQNIVRVMTVHQSKGLEFPAVILMGLGRQFNARDLYDSILMHDKALMGVEIIDPDQGFRVPSQPKKLLAHVLKKEMIAEEIRLLYVGMTRAKERLLLMGSRRPPKEETKSSGRKKKESGAVHPDAAEAMPEVIKADYVLPIPDILEAKDSLSWLMEILDHKEMDSILRHRRQLPDSEIPEETVVPYEPVSGTEEDEPREVPKALLEKLLWTYPDPWRISAPRVVSVSELKAGQYTYEEEAESPQEELAPFLITEEDHEPSLDQEDAEVLWANEIEQSKDQETAAVTDSRAVGAKRGTAFHHVMGMGDWSSLRENPAAEMDRLVAAGHLTEEEKALIPISWIKSAFRCPTVQESYGLLQQGGSIHREESFLLRVPYEEIGFKEQMDEPETASGSRRGLEQVLQEESNIPRDKVMVQGIIDLFFETEKGLVLVDYKTDYHLDEVRLNAYSKQLSLYRRALETGLQKPVIRSVLIDVRHGKEIEC